MLLLFSLMRQFDIKDIYYIFLFIPLYCQQNEVVSGAVVDVLHAVLAGNDGCVLCFGGASLGKTYTMLGSHTGPGELGVMPSTVAWLYRAIVEQKAKSGARFSVRVSAVAVDAAGALFTDLLAEYAQGERPLPLLCALRFGIIRRLPLWFIKVLKVNELLSTLQMARLPPVHCSETRPAATCPRWLSCVRPRRRPRPITSTSRLLRGPRTRRCSPASSRLRPRARPRSSTHCIFTSML